MTALAVLLFCAGGYLGQKYYQPQTITEYKVFTVDRVIEKVVYQPVEKVIETVVYEPVETIVYQPIEKPVVKEVEVPRPLMQFKNLAGLKEWLSNIKLIDIQFTVVGQTVNSIQEFDCDDYAIRLQEDALQEGYLISFEVIHQAEYNSLFTQKKLPAGAIHAINSVIIGNSVYYIEPQTHEIVFVAKLD